MSGLKTMHEPNRLQVAAAVQAIPGDKHFVWDGLDEDERPLSAQEMQAGMAAGMAALAKKRGRPMGSGNKEQVALRVDREVLAAFRATGTGWQTRMNEALKEWLQIRSNAS